MESPLFSGNEGGKLDRRWVCDEQRSPRLKTRVVFWGWGVFMIHSCNRFTPSPPPRPPFPFFFECTSCLLNSVWRCELINYHITAFTENYSHSYTNLLKSCDGVRSIFFFFFGYASQFGSANQNLGFTLLQVFTSQTVCIVYLFIYIYRFLWLKPHEATM